MSHRFEVLDDVFHAFLETNSFQGLHLSMDDIMRMRGKLRVKYEHTSIPYLATVSFFPGHDTNWVTVKLCNNGFRHAQPDTAARETVCRHKSAGWIFFPQGFEAFKHLKAALPPGFSKQAIFYNIGEKRLDVKLFADNPAAPSLLITFEPGVPFDDDRFQAQVFKR